MEKANITLLPTEKEIFDLLLAVAKETGSTLRVAGGWVRDRLLNKVNDDIDISIDNMSGYEFAQKVSEYAQKHNIEGVSRPSEIQANPEQSKKLATGVIHVFGMSIDFVQLRKDVDYPEDSRIPETEIGTPEEDARRRDFTVNALFYNINTGEIEDYVGGREDLKKKLIKTPIDPLTSFTDDPLRILRAIRFAARFGFDIDPKTKGAIKNEKIQELFKNKVSKERVAKEIYKMFITKRPDYAAKLIYELGLRDELFYIDPELAHDKKMMYEFPAEKLTDWSAEQGSSYHKLTIWDHSVESLKNMSEATQEDVPNIDRFVRNMAMLLHDVGKRFRDIQTKTPEGWTQYKGHETISYILAKAILTRLKFSKEIIDRVTRLVNHHMRLHNLERAKKVAARTLRRFVRDLKEDWIYAIDVAIADAKAKDIDAEVDTQFYEDLKKRIEKEINIESEQKPTPVLSGNELMDLYKRELEKIGDDFIPKPGPWIGQVHRYLLDELQLENPEITKEEAWQKILIKFPPEKIKNFKPVAKRARKECSICGAPMFDFRVIRDKDTGERKVLQLSDCIHREKNIVPINPEVEECMKRREEPQLELDLPSTKEEKDLSRETLRKKYKEFKNILIEMNIDKEQIPSFGEFIAARMYEGDNEEQAAIDGGTPMPLYDFDAGAGGTVGVGDYVGMGAGGDTYGYGSAGGEGPGGSYSLWSVDYSRPVSLAFKKEAQTTYGSLIKAKCPKCGRWIKTTTAQYVARGHRVRCPKHGRVKPKRFRLVSLSQLLKKRGR